ncbi:MAG TPA: hypothetical protein VF278_07085 [Pirellulales bacterium]
MTQPIGHFSSIAATPQLQSQAAAAVQSSTAAPSQPIQDMLNISQQAQAASAKLDADGDGDGH